MEIKRCKKCSVTLTRDNAVMRGKYHNKIGGICTYCRSIQNKADDKKRRKKQYVTMKKHIEQSRRQPQNCTYCGSVIGRTQYSGIKLHNNRINCCLKCAKTKKDIYQNLHTNEKKKIRPLWFHITQIYNGTLYKGFYNKCIIGFGNYSDFQEFCILRDLQIKFAGVATGGRTAKVGQGVVVVDDILDKDGNIIGHQTVNATCTTKGCGEFDATTGEFKPTVLRYDKRDYVYCPKCNLLY